MTYELDPDCELPPHLLALFLRSAPSQLQELVAVCTRHDTEAARAQAHKLKGGLYAAGASRLAERVESLRGALAAGNFPECAAQLATIRQEFASMLAEIESRLTAGSP